MLQPMTIIYWYMYCTHCTVHMRYESIARIDSIHTYCILFKFHHFSFFPGLGIRSSVFWVNRWVFLWKNLKKFGERPERFSHIALFWRATWELTSLIKKEGTRESFVVFLLFTYKKCTKKYNFRQIFFERIDHSLICHERPEQFAQSCSFDVGDLSDLLTVFLLIWAIFANERMSKFPDLLFSFLRIENIKPCWGIELESFLAICQNIMCKGF